MEFHLETSTIVDVLLTVGMAVLSFIYRLHVTEYNKTVKRLEAADEKSERKLETMQSESNQALEKKFNELRQDLYGRLLEEANHRKEVFETLQNNSADFWKGLNTIKDNAHAFETTVLKTYHTKDELSRLFDDKLTPVMRAIEHMQNQWTGEQKRRAGERP